MENLTSNFLINDSNFKVKMINYIEDHTMIYMPYLMLNFAGIIFGTLGKTYFYALSFESSIKKVDK